MVGQDMYQFMFNLTDMCACKQDRFNPYMWKECLLSFISVCSSIVAFIKEEINTDRDVPQRVLVEVSSRRSIYTMCYLNLQS